jgi:hypothetical protein
MIFGFCADKQLALKLWFSENKRKRCGFQTQMLGAKMTYNQLCINGDRETGQISSPLSQNPSFGSVGGGGSSMCSYGADDNIVRHATSMELIEKNRHPW